MNRQERRSGRGGNGGGLRSRLDQAIRCHQSGRLDEAESFYRQILALDPRNSDCWHLRGVIALQKGQPEVSVELIGKAIGIRGNVAAFHSNLGNALSACGRYQEALACYRRAISIEPNFAEAHNNLGYALTKQGMQNEAAQCYGRALAVNPSYAEARLNLGDLLRAQGRLGEALACFERVVGDQPNNVNAHFCRGNLLRALKRMDAAAECYEFALLLQPDMVEAAFNLGNTRRDQGRYAAAEAWYRHLLERQPAYVDAWINLGNCCRETNRRDEAILYLFKALELDEQRVETNYNLALTLIEAGRGSEALAPAVTALQSEASPRNRSLVVDCLSHVDTDVVAADDLPALTEILIQALDEGWGRPGLLVANGLRLLKRQAFVASAFRRLALAQTVAPDPPHFEDAEWQAFASDRLLLSLLCAAPLADLGVECLLTGIRSAMLHQAMVAKRVFEPPLEQLYSAIAQQCYINEYVFAAAESELEMAGRARSCLAEALADGQQPSPPMLLAVAAYFPLSSILCAEFLLSWQWPKAIATLLVQQVSEPLVEAKLRDAIPQLTEVENGVSLLVRQQYEEHPYPRWIRTGGSAGGGDIDERMRRQFPLAFAAPLRKGNEFDILIAGCGTGQQSIDTALSFPAARVLAVDLSRASLAYAVRKTREMGIDNVTYGQADILHLGRIGRSFDLIESGGVLHHLADPFAGWRVLLSLLRPGGLMRLGLYSELARRDVVEARKFIAARCFRQDADAIRECRQAMIACGAKAAWRPVLDCADFFTTSECRDLLFHVQEHRLNLVGIDSFLADNDLAFLGFELDSAVLSRYCERFPDDPAAVDLARWQSFEHDYPDTFRGMYQFWIQRKSAHHDEDEKKPACAGLS